MAGSTSGETRKLVAIRFKAPQASALLTNRHTIEQLPDRRCWAGLEDNVVNRTLRGLLPLLVIGMLAPSLLRGQSEDVLAQYFLGRTVTVKMDMPANKDGVDVYPGRQPAINYNDYSQRIKRYGISLHSGDKAPVTKVHVKDKLVEFQLAGGGYGTAGDEKDTAVIFTPTPKSSREKDLERDIKSTTDQQKKRRMQDEVNDMRQHREREDARLQAAANVAQEQRRQRIYERAQQAGSRFNLKFPDRVVLESLTPDAVMQALAQYLDFAAPGAPAAPPVASAIPAGIHKGMLPDEVDALLGRPVEVQRTKEGSLDVSHSTYEQGPNIVEAVFVEGVLVRYTLRSK
jgi:hypothetical protein